jgi:hypothetical protein
MPTNTRRSNFCDNMNHLRPNAPVVHCPDCGGVVNRNARGKQCDEAKHAASRRQQSTFCVDCGTQLIDRALR